jgi:hypothetical protein
LPQLRIGSPKIIDLWAELFDEPYTPTLDQR